MKRSMTNSNNTSLKNFESIKTDENSKIKISNKLRKSSQLLKENSFSKSQNSFKIEKDEEKEFVEFVLGDFYDFYKITDLQKFTKMTSLSIVNDMINDMGPIIENIPNKNSIIYLCLNENYIKKIKFIELLPNLKKLHLNFNLIEEIDINISKINSLKQFWVCDNKIKIIENLPENIEDFWIARNLIENLPNDFDKYKNIQILNLAGNCITDFKDIYILEKFKNLKVLYLNNCNFGENPICTYQNYRMMMIRLFKNLNILDQYKITFDEREEIEYSYLKKTIYYKKKIRDNKILTKKINKLLKAHKLMFKGIKYHNIRVLSQKQKLLEYQLYEKEQLGVQSDIKLTNIKKELIILRDKILNILNEINQIEKKFKIIKQFLSDLNDLSIVINFYEIESYGNFKIEPGNIDLKWVKLCLELFKSNDSNQFLINNKLKMKFNKIFKVHNKKIKTIFDSLYDNLIDLNGKFGIDKNFFDFYFLILPKKNLTYRDIFYFLFEKQENEGEMILTNNISLINQFSLNQNKNNKNFITIICKCINFDSMIEEFKTEKKFNSIDEIINEIKTLNSEKDILKLQLLNNGNSSYLYYYKIERAIEPLYIVEYEYCDIEKKNEEEEIIISSFDEEIYISNKYGNIFEFCCKELCFEGNKQFFSKEIIKKYFFKQFICIDDLNDNLIFFAKNSILNYLKQCFNYNKINDFKDEIALRNDEINEITFTNLKKTFKQFFLSTNENEKLNINKVKSLNIFNNEYSDSDLNELLNQIHDLSKVDSKILGFTKKIEKIILSNNHLESINLAFICQLFPNVKEINLSHNEIKHIKYEPKETTNNVNKIDISFNNINDFSYVILILKQFNSLLFFKFFANPYDCFCEQKFCFNPSNYNISQENKIQIINEYEEYIKYKKSQKIPLTITKNINNVENEMLNFKYVYNQYAYSDKYLNFCNNFYFREKFTYSTSLKTIDLSKKKLLSVPNINGEKTIQILILNLNKIEKINNLSKFENLIELFIQNNKVFKIENLPKNLKKLDLSNNELNELDNLSNCNNLEWLNLENNMINQLDEIKKLSKLKELYLSENKINSLKECYKLGKLNQIEIIDLYGNEVCNNNEELRIIMIDNCPKLRIFNRIVIDEIEKYKSKNFFAGRLTGYILEKRLGQNYNTRNILELNLSNLKLKDQFNLFSKDNYPKLRKLDISKNCFKTFSIFGSLPNLKELNFEFNLFVDIISKRDKIINGKGIKGLSILEKLVMSNNQIINLNGIQYLKSLKILILRNNNFSNIDSLNNMDNLIYLDVSNNKIENIDRNNIGDLPSLQSFICDQNLIKNINGLINCNSIKFLSSQDNKIDDIIYLNQLSNLKQLIEIKLKGNPITNIDNYRENLIQLIPSLKKIDEIVIIEKERENSKINELKESLPDYNCNSNKKNQTINTQKSFKFNINNNDSEKIKISLPQIKIGKPPSSQSNKRIFNGIQNNENEKLSQIIPLDVGKFKIINNKK